MRPWFLSGLNPIQMNITNIYHIPTVPSKQACCLGIDVVQFLDTEHTSQPKKIPDEIEDRLTTIRNVFNDTEWSNSKSLTQLSF